DAGGTPDQLSLVLLQSRTVVGTDDPSGADSLLTVNFDSSNPAFNAFASELTSAPIVTRSSPVPEPGSLPLLATTLMSALCCARRFRRSNPRALWRRTAPPSSTR